MHFLLCLKILLNCHISFFYELSRTDIFLYCHILLHIMTWLCNCESSTPFHYIDNIDEIHVCVTIWTLMCGLMTRFDDLHDNFMYMLVYPQQLCLCLSVILLLDHVPVFITKAWLSIVSHLYGYHLCYYVSVYIWIFYLGKFAKFGIMCTSLSVVQVPLLLYMFVVLCPDQVLWAICSAMLSNTAMSIEVEALILDCIATCSRVCLCF